MHMLELYTLCINVSEGHLKDQKFIKGKKIIKKAYVCNMFDNYSPQSSPRFPFALTRSKQG